MGGAVFWKSIAVGGVILIALELDVIRRGLETRLRVHLATLEE